MVGLYFGGIMPTCKLLRGFWITGNCQAHRQCILIGSEYGIFHDVYRDELWLHRCSRLLFLQIVNWNTALLHQTEEPPSAYECMKLILSEVETTSTKTGTEFGCERCLYFISHCLTFSHFRHRTRHSVPLAAQQSILGGKRKQPGNNPLMSVFQLTVNTTDFLMVSLGESAEETGENVHQKM